MTLFSSPRIKSDLSVDSFKNFYCGPYRLFVELLSQSVGTVIKVMTSSAVGKLLCHLSELLLPASQGRRKRCALA